MLFLNIKLLNTFPPHSNKKSEKCFRSTRYKKHILHSITHNHHLDKIFISNKEKILSHNTLL